MIYMMAMHSHDPSSSLASQRASGLSPMRMMSMASPCFRLSSFLPPLQSTRALALWMICTGPVSCGTHTNRNQEANTYRGKTKSLTMSSFSKMFLGFYAFRGGYILFYFANCWAFWTLITTRQCDKRQN